MHQVGRKKKLYFKKVGCVFFPGSQLQIQLDGLEQLPTTGQNTCRFILYQCVCSGDVKADTSGISPPAGASVSRYFTGTFGVRQNNIVTERFIGDKSECRSTFTS